MSFLRRLTINVENLSQDRCAFLFSGENFESGGWKEIRTQRFTDFAALEFESQSLFSGLSGYVVFSNTDHSQLLTMAFAVPITTAPCFSVTGRIDAWQLHTHLFITSGLTTEVHPYSIQSSNFHEHHILLYVCQHREPVYKPFFLVSTLSPSTPVRHVVVLHSTVGICWHACRTWHVPARAFVGRRVAPGKPRNWRMNTSPCAWWSCHPKAPNYLKLGWTCFKKVVAVYGCTFFWVGWGGLGSRFGWCYYHLLSIDLAFGHRFNKWFVGVYDVVSCYLHVICAETWQFPSKWWRSKAISRSIKQ